MVLNAKIVEKKVGKILKILDEDGGTSLIEAQGLLAFLSFKLYMHASMMEQKQGAELAQLYKQAKDKRTRGLNG